MCEEKDLTDKELENLDEEPKTFDEEIKLPDKETEPVDNEPKDSIDDNKKKKNGNSRFSFLKGFVTGALVFLFAAIIFRGYIQIPINGGQSIINIEFPTLKLLGKNVNGVNERLVNKKIHEINTILNENYLYEADRKTIQECIYTGMMYGIYMQDPYAAYYTNEAFKDEQKQSAGEYVGVGFTVQKNPGEEGGILVVEVSEGTPAAEAGVLKDDIVIKVNDEDIREKDMSEVVDKMIIGEAGTSVKLTVLRGGEELELVCERRRIETKTVSYNMIDGYKLGYVKVNSFVGVTVDQFETALGELEAEGAKGIVVDMRDNAGGDVNVCLSMLDGILPNDIDTYTKEEADWYEQGKTLLLAYENRKKERFSYCSDDSMEYPLPIVVLVNKNTASSAEIFAGTLKSYGYPVVGEKTFGKGIVQTITPLSDGSAIKYTSDQYILPNGDMIHQKGIEPDYVIANEEGSEEDLQLDKAIEVLWDEVLNGDE
ncbi:MAG: S41 family peptidase [Eubacteriales bacterium]|nr:S41 family peptidase [Eubacteriales bacterium]